MISVVIPSYNSEKTIDKCLQSLRKQSHTGHYEIILVDSSTDRTPEIVSLNHPEIKYIHLAEKTDPGTARNMGVAEARGDIIALIDSDCVADQDWLDRIYDAHQGNINAVGGAVLNGNGKGDLVGLAGYIAEFREFIPGQPKREATHIPTCNISYRKRVFDAYGGFQREYYPQEDLVFNYKLHSAGEKIIFDPSIQVYHHHRSKLGEFIIHQKRIGRITSRVLKQIPLEGSFIARNRALALLLIPFLPFVKFIRTVSTFIRCDPATICRKPQVLGIFALGLVYWTFGFSQGVFVKD
jgi:glycosyltransferase involved in cell wall biosynthesis